MHNRYAQAFLIAVLLLCGGSLHAQSATAYVTPTGGAVGTCPSGATTFTPAAFSTSGNWGTGASQIGAGTTVKLCGTFTASAGASEYLVFKGSGSSGNPITTVCDTGTIIQATYWSGFAIDLNGQSYLTLNGTNCTLRATANGTSLANQVDYGCGICSGANVSNTTVENWTISNIYVHVCTGAGSSNATPCPTTNDNTGGENTAGIQIWAGTNDTIEYNTVNDVHWGIVVDYGGGATTSSGIIIQHNTVYDMDHGAILGDQESGSKLSSSNCTTAVHDNDFSNMQNWDDNGDNNHHDATHFWANGASSSSYTGVCLYNNYAHGNMGWHPSGMFTFESLGSGSYMFNNVVGNLTGNSACADGALALFTGAGSNGSGQYIINNTVDPGSGTQCSINQSDLGIAQNGTATVENNLFLTNAQTFVHSASGDISTADYNTYGTPAGSNPFYGACGSGVSFATWQSSCGFDAHGQVVGIRVTSSYNLPSGSPAIHAGANLTSLGITALDFDKNGIPRPATGPWDAGAYQYENTDGPAILPTLFSTTFPNTAGYTVVTVCASGCTYTAVETAVAAVGCSTVIQVRAGATFATASAATFTQTCSPTTWIVMESDNCTSAGVCTNLPTQGNRLASPAACTPGCVYSQIASPIPTTYMPLIEGKNANNTATISIGTGAAYIWLGPGLNITGPANGTSYNQGGIILDADTTPSNIVLDRSYLNCAAAQDCVHLWQQYGAYEAVVDSIAIGAHCDAGGGVGCTQSQAIIEDGGIGPFKIVNNTLGGSSETVLFGGGTCPSPSLGVGTNIEISGNYLFYDWGSRVSTFKNSNNIGNVRSNLELKEGAYALLQGNIYDGSAVAGLSLANLGFGILERSGDSGCTNVSLHDVTTRYNETLHTSVAISLQGGFDSGTVAFNDFSIHDNLSDDNNSANGTGTVPNAFALIATNDNSYVPLTNLLLSHNTIINSNRPNLWGVVECVSASYPAAGSFIVTNNAGFNGTYGYGAELDSGLVQGVAGLNDCAAPGYSWTGNGWIDIAGAQDLTWPSGNTYAGSAAAADFSNFNSGSGGNYQFTSASPFISTAADGGQPGVSNWTCFNLLMSLTTNGIYTESAASCAGPDYTLISRSYPNDSRFGTDAVCTGATCIIPSFTGASGDAGKHILIAGAGTTTTDCCHAVTYNTAYTSTVQSGSSGATVNLGSSPTYNVQAPGALWMLWPTTDDTSRIQTAITANQGGSMTVGPGYYSISATNTAVGMGVAPPQITCAAGAVFLYPLGTATANKEFDFPGSTTPGGGFTNCTFQGINAAGYAYGHGTNQQVLIPANGYGYPILVESSGAGQGGDVFTNNSFYNSMGYAAIHLYGSGTSGVIGDSITYNNSADEAQYCWDVDYGSSNVIEHNLGIDCSIGTETDAIGYVNQSNLFEYNYLSYSHNYFINYVPSGYPLIAINCSPNNSDSGTTNVCSNNWVDGTGAGPGLFNAMGYVRGNTYMGYPIQGTYANNVASNGAQCSDSYGGLNPHPCGVNSTTFVAPPVLCSLSNIMGCVGSTTPRPNTVAISTAPAAPFMVKVNMVENALH